VIKIGLQKNSIREVMFMEIRWYYMGSLEIYVHIYVQGYVTGEDVYNVLPFNNTVDRIQLTGAQLKDVLEDAVLDFCPDQTCEPEHFYQVRLDGSSLQQVRWVVFTAG